MTQFPISEANKPRFTSALPAACDVVVLGGGVIGVMTAWHLAERGLKDKVFFAGTGLPSVAGKYLQDGDIQYIQFWDPAVAAYAMNTLAVMALSEKKDEIKAGLNLGLKGYESLTTPEGASPNLLYGQGWVGVTKDNMADYNF